MRLTEAIERLVIATKANSLSITTAECYRRKLQPLVAFLGDVPVEQITAEDIQRYILHLREKTTRWANHPAHPEIKGPLSMATINSMVRATKRLFNWLEQEGIIPEAPTRRIKTPRPGRVQPKAISKADFQKLLATTEGESVIDRRDRAILLFLLDTGCRVGGLCNLRVDDLDLNQNQAVLIEKGRKARCVPFTPQTAKALKAWLEVRPDDQGDWVFVSMGSKSRGQLLPSGVSQMIKRRALKAGVKGQVNPHAFRHAFAREYLLNGGDLASLADLMGHTSVEVTRASYAIFSVKELQEKHRKHSPVANLLKDEGNVEERLSSSPAPQNQPDDG